MKESWTLRPFVIVALALALALLIAACSDSGNGDAISAVAADVSAQSSELDALSTQVGELQAGLADAQKMESDEVAELRAAITEMSGQNMAPEPFDDSALRSDIGEVRTLITELQDRMAEDDQDDQRIDSEHLSNLDAQLMELGDTLAELKASISGDEGAMDDLASDLGALRSELMALRDASASIEIDDALGRLVWLEKALGPAYTKSYVEEAIRRYDTQGRQATLDYYNTMDSVSGDLYLFVLDQDYKLIVHPTVPTTIGMDIRGPLGTDITGKNYGIEALTVDENGKWVDYVYLNPADNFDYERKHSWIVRHDNLIFGSGWYERDVTLESTPATYTRALVEQAVARYDANGRDATIDYYNSPESVDGQYYVFIGDENDMMLAHATVPANVGKHFNDVISPDGYPAGAQVAAAAVEGGAWTTYTYLNTATSNVETKHSWVTRHNGMIFGSGWYEEGAPKSDAAAYTKAFVGRAVNLYDDLGREGTIAYYNSSDSVDGQWYVFIGDENDIMLAHATIPANVGKHFNDVISPDGYPAGAQVAAAAVEGGAWTTYTYLNTATGNVETKHSWVTRHNGMIFGSGWYEEGPPKSEAAAYTQSLVQRAVNLYDDLGQDGTVDYYNTPESVDGQFYVFILQAHDLRTLANGARPELVDIDPPARIDAAGYAYGEAFAATTDEGHWVSYVFINPATDQLESKHTWIMEHDGLMFGSGWYTEPADYTQYLVDQAIDMYKADGREATLDHFNDPSTVDGQWYVYIIDADSKVSLANAARPEFVGAPPTHRIDPTGYNYGEALYSATEEGKWISYIIKNPATEEQRRKHAWVVLHDDLFFGAGYYE